MTAEHSAANELLVALQRGIPLVDRPFEEMGARMGVTGDEVLAKVRELFDRGLARRFGAVFDSRSLGYGSTLCAVDVPPAELERTAALLAPHPGVTHCYEREGQPNLWFTLTARADRFDAEMQALAWALAPFAILALPAIRRFKVQVILDAPAEGDAAVPVRPAPERGTDIIFREFTEQDKALVRRLQGNIPVTACPFQQVADELSRNPGEILDRLREWEREGILRRIGIILRHRDAGFTANGMCVWRVPPSDVERVGQEIARTPEVTHCYERPAGDAFPYNLYAMVHAREPGVTQDLFRTLSEQAGTGQGKILMSVREFKKSSPLFFCEDDETGGTAG